MKPTLLVLAAGMGSRYGGLKQVDPVGPAGEILLEYSIYDAIQAGFGRLVFVIREEIEAAFRQSIGARLQGKIPIDYVFQELGMLPGGARVPEGRTKPWGTGHAIWCARERIEEPFAAINADDFYGGASFHVVADYLRDPSQDYCMVGFRLKNTLSEHGSVSRGLCKVEDGWLASVVEHTDIQRNQDGVIRSAQSQDPLTGEEVVSMNFWGLHPSIFPELTTQLEVFLRERGHEPKSELYIPSVLDEVIQRHRGKVRVLASPENWFGVTYPQDKPVVVDRIGRKIEQGLYPNPLWS